MNLTTTLFYVDRNLTQEQLVAGVAKALGVRSDLIAILDLTQQDNLPAGWFEETDAVAVQMDSMRGDFPLEVSIASRAAFDVEAFTRRLAPALHAALITDEFGVNPLSDVEWTLISPSGEITQVFTDEDAFGADDSAIVLRPESRRIYDSHLAHAAAD